MSELECKTDQIPRKWYNSYEFPLIPVITKKKGDEWNTSSWSFNWLFIRLWTLDAFEFEIGIVIDTHWGIGVIGILPYLRWVVAIPAPYSIQRWTQTNLWRKPKKLKSNQLD